MRRFRKPLAQRRAAQRWRHRNPKHVHAYNATYWQAHKDSINRQRRIRLKDTAPYATDALTIVTHHEASNPNLTYIDKNGRIWRDDNLSAEELIRQFERRQRSEKQKATREKAP